MFLVFLTSGCPDPQGLECNVQHPRHPWHLICLQGCGGLWPRPLQSGAWRRQRGTLPLPALWWRHPVLPGQAACHTLPSYPGHRAGQHQPFWAGHPAVPPRDHGTCGPPCWWAEGQVLWFGLQPEWDHGQIRRAVGSNCLRGRRFVGGREVGWWGGGRAEGDEIHLYAEEGFRERKNFRSISSSSTFALPSWRFLFRLKEKQRPPSLVTSQKERKKLPKSS